MTWHVVIWKYTDSYTKYVAILFAWSVSTAHNYITNTIFQSETFHKRILSLDENGV